MDNDFQLDLKEVFTALDKAEVVTIFFPVLGKALLIDVRSDKAEGPLVVTVPMVPSVEERVRSIERLRPHFGRPRGIVAIPWLRRVESLRQLGVIASVVQRITAAGGAGTDCEAAFQDLLHSECDQLVAAVRGADYQTLWQRG